MKTEQDRAASTQRWWRPSVAPLALLALAALLQLLASLFPHAVERYYSRGIYPFIARLTSSANGFTGVSIAEVVLCILLVALIAWLARQVWLLLKRRRSWRSLALRTLAGALWLAATGALALLFVWGFNYQRVSLFENMQLVEREPTAAEVEFASRAIIEGINRNYAESGAEATAEHGSTMPFTRGELYAQLESAFKDAPLPAGNSVAHARPKPVYFSGIMSRFGISGIYSPLTGEPNYNALQPDSSLPFSVAHEMAHQRGFAREDEASFIAFIVCTRAAHPYVRYCGYLGILRILRVLYRVAPERYREVSALVGEGPRRDVRAATRFWMNYSGRLSDAALGINNLYLKANRIKSGVRNYDEVAALVIGYYLKETVAEPLSLFEPEGVRRLNSAHDFD